MNNSVAKSDRLFCLDVLRGLDMLLLTVIGPFVAALDATFGLSAAVRQQFTHPSWGGITLWDIIMPLFIFMCGAAVPFGLGKRLDGGRAGWAYWRHVASRFVVLWLLGMVAQGHLLTLDTARFAYFSNTLQAIAVGYVVAAAAFLIRRPWIRRAIPVVLVALYALLLHFGGDYSPDGNLAMSVDMFVVRAIQPLGHDTGRYTWYLTSLMFGAMTLMGMEATLVLKGGGTAVKKALTLGGVGGVCLGLGWALVPVIPCIKQIFTLTFTLQAMGWCFWALTVLYVVTDIFKLRRGWWLVLLFGQTALFAYLCAEVFGTTFDAFARQLTQGVAHVFGVRAVPIAQWLASSALLALVLVARRRFVRKV